jgi:hypothetical protein
VDRASAPWGDKTTFTATMRDTTAGVPTGTMVTGKAIMLDGTGVIGVSSSQTTDSSGKATFTGTAPTNVATGWAYQGHFAGDALCSSRDSVTRTLTVSSPSIAASTTDAERSTAEEPASNDEDTTSDGDDDESEQDGSQNDRGQNDRAASNSNNRTTDR